MRNLFGALRLVKTDPEIIVDRFKRPRPHWLVRAELILFWVFTVVGCATVLVKGVEFIAGMAR